MAYDRPPRRAEPMRVPRPVPDDQALIIVDTTWGIVQPIELAPGVRAIGELELIAHLESGGVAFDVRVPEHLAAGTIEGSRALSHRDLPERLDEVPIDLPFAVFCNGPQCPATADAVAKLIASGCDPTLILYYRGGIQDWMTLGYPLVPEVADPVRAGRHIVENRTPLASSTSPTTSKPSSA